jgi:hypothetical protein
VRGRRSGRGGQRSDRGGAPWWRRTRCGAGGVGEQSEKATASVVSIEEEDDREISWPGFASRCCGQALGAGGAR